MHRMLWLALLASACAPERPVGTCVFWADCGEGGACEYTAGVAAETAQFDCSFADTSCPSGRRFGELASDTRADQCVEFSGGFGGICDDAHPCGEGVDCKLGRCVNVKSIDATENAFAALCSDHLRAGGDFWLWGFALEFNPTGSLGIAAFLDAAPLTPVNADNPEYRVANTTSMSMGDNHACLIGTTTDDAPYSICLGRSGPTPDLAVGPADATISTTFIGLDTPGGPHSQISAGITHSCGMRADSTQIVDCWGENAEKQLDGTMTVDDHLTVSVPNRVTTLTTGPNFTCVGTTVGVTCWGTGTWNPNTFPMNNGSAQPVQGLPVTIATQVAAGQQHACAILDEQVWCWGANDGGQVTGAATTVRQLPVQPLGDTPVISIAAGRQHSCAVTAEHRVMCWGANGVGQLGVADLTSPVVVPLEARAVGPIALTNDATCALLEDSLVHCWGSPDLTTNYTPPLVRFPICL